MRLYFMILVSSSFLTIEVFAQGGKSCKTEVDLVREIYKSQGNYNQVIETIESCVTSEGKIFSNQNLSAKDQALAKALYLNSVFHDNDTSRIEKLGGVEVINKEYQKISKELSNFGIKIQQNQRLVDLPDEIAEKETQLKAEEEKKKEDLARKIREERERSCRDKTAALLKSTGDNLKMITQKDSFIYKQVFGIYHQCYAHPDTTRVPDGWQLLSSNYDFDFPFRTVIQLSNSDDSRARNQMLEKGIENALRLGQKEDARKLWTYLIRYPKYSIERSEGSARFVRFYNWQSFLTQKVSYWKLGLSFNSGHINTEYAAQPGIGISLHSPELFITDPLGGKGKYPLILDLRLHLSAMRRSFEPEDLMNNTYFEEFDLWAGIGPNLHIPLVWGEKHQLTVNGGVAFGFLAWNRSRLNEERPGPFFSLRSVRDLELETRSNNNNWIRMGFSYGNRKTFTLNLNYNYPLGSIHNEDFDEAPTLRFIERELGEGLPNPRLGYLDIEFLWTIVKKQK